MSRVIVGTEIYLSERFSRVWFNAANANLQGFDVIVFDNNPEGEAESVWAKAECEANGWVYWRMMPGSLQCHSVEALAVYARTNGFSVMVHLDADCPPIPGLVQRLVGELDSDTAAVSENGMAYAFAVWVHSAATMPCERIAYRDGQVTPFSQAMLNHTPSQNNGVWYFDHCRYFWHHLTLLGLKVKAGNYGAIHATIPSGFHKKSRRYKESEADSRLAKLHADFFNHPEIAPYDR